MTVHPVSELSAARGRFYIFLAAILWSTSGAFTKILTKDTVFHFNEPPLDDFPLLGLQIPLLIAFYRTLFAGLTLVPTLKFKDLTFRGMMVVSAVTFAAMNATFITALALGTSANAILLQYSAPLWVYLAGLFWLGEKGDRQGTITMMIGLVGIGIIVAGGWNEGNLAVVFIALASGVAYAGVLICLRLLRDVSSPWITVWNHLWSAVVLLPWVLTLRQPTLLQLAVLFCYGAVQMGLAYWLVAKGLRVVTPQEAGTISLLEPILNPLWAYLVSPDTETPSAFTYIGGGVILAALAWRYWPRTKSVSTSSNS